MPRDGSAPAAAPQPAASPAKPVPVGALLAALVGPIAAAALFIHTPAEESGRKVEATVQADGGIAVKHVAGPQYLRAYLDIVKVETACDGITGPEIREAYRKGLRFTEDQCLRMLESALVEHARGALACTPSLKTPGRDYQRVAVVLLTYNIGVPRYCRSTVDRRLDAGDVRGGCDAFRMWNRAGGRVVKGLVNRRERERTICLTGLPLAPPVGFLAGLPAELAQHIPPLRYQGDNDAQVLFRNAKGIGDICGVAKPPSVIIACAGIANPVMALPNPCPFADREFYALVACHELAHVNGWAKDHPRPAPPPVPQVAKGVGR